MDMFMKTFGHLMTQAQHDHKKYLDAKRRKIENELITRDIVKIYRDGSTDKHPPGYVFKELLSELWAGNVIRPVKTFKNYPYVVVTHYIVTRWWLRNRHLLNRDHDRKD